MIDYSAAGEDLRRHSGMKFAQQREHVFRRHELRHLRKSDHVGEQHRDRLPPTLPERLVLGRQQIDNVR